MLVSENFISLLEFFYSFIRSVV